MTSLVRADGLVVVPAGLEGHHAGADVDVQLLRGLADIDDLLSQQVPFEQQDEQDLFWLERDKVEVFDPCLRTMRGTRD